MRTRLAAVGPVALLALGLGAGVGACLDLFHSTGDILTACQADPSLSGCRADAAVAPATSDAVDVCASTPTTARQEADRACAWLGACETPMGHNAFGPCTVQARMAYDCASNPAHRVAGAELAFWSCMLQANTCSDVDGCVFPAGRPACPGTSAFLSCGATAAGATGNGDVLVACDADAGAPHGQNCAMAGQTCALGGAAGAACAGPAGFGCSGSACNGMALDWCASGASVDLGLDCADNGAQRCDTFPSHDNARWAACLPGAAADASLACAPSASAACEGGVASSCLSGVVETLDCATLLGIANACAPGPLSPTFDWTSACAVSPPACAADACDDAGTILTGCARGAALSVDCAEAGLGPCQLHAIDADGDGGGETRAACAPP